MKETYFDGVDQLTSGNETFHFVGDKQKVDPDLRFKSSPPFIREETLDL